VRKQQQQRLMVTVLESITMMPHTTIAITRGLALSIGPTGATEKKKKRRDARSGRTATPIVVYVPDPCAKHHLSYSKEKKNYVSGCSCSCADSEIKRLRSATIV
jgi:hypothetical protein